MEATSNSSQRSEFFQKLKPCCVSISQLAIRESSDVGTAARELNDLTERLLLIINEQLQQNPLALDEKLAEYVFFPLYHIFRQMNRYPTSLVENCVKCLTILIVHGWKSKISAKLVQQVLTLLTFIIDGTPDSKEESNLPEETVLEAFRGLNALFTTSGQSAAAASGLADADTIPALGHSITVMLDGVVDGATPQIQQEALRTIQAVYTAIKEHAALASFLPGTVSSLAKVLSTPTRYRKAVLAASLDTVGLVLARVLGDVQTRSIFAQGKTDEEDDNEKGKKLTLTWLKGTANQIQRALPPVLKLRTHDSAEVRGLLQKLCIKLLDECHKSLENCTAYLVETAMVLGRQEVRDSLTETTLQDLVGIYPELAETVKSTLYNLMSSLPRIMQGGDEDKKRNILHSVLNGLSLIKDLRIESSTLEDSISSALKDSIVSMTLSSKTENNIGTSDIELLDQRLIKGGEIKFQPVLMIHESQRSIRSEILALVEFIGSNSQQASLVGNMFEYARESTSTDQIAAFWLCFQMVKASDASSVELDQFLDMSSLTAGPGEDLETISHELYSFAVQTLDNHTIVDSADWQLEAIALEMVAYTAQKSGVSFRPDLIDVLFPIATLLGSERSELRQHAVFALNSIAMSCDYGSVSQLIIDNVDYMVNSISLRLNTLDISPASIHVLRMMISLTGPKLIPYLDDVVESIFGALDSYHGYSTFVEGLFMVLKEVVEQGVRSDLLLLDNQKAESVDNRKHPPIANGIESLLDTLATRKTYNKNQEVEGHSHPERPWATEAKDVEITEPSNAEGEEEKPPNTPTYQLLLRVANLTQHYLTSPTPTLRRSLLELLATASIALAPDQDAFLPLVNAVWPVVIDRMRDSETYVIVEACHAVSGLCAAAGDFLSSRFKTEWWDWLGEWCRRTKRKVFTSRGRTKPHGEQMQNLGLNDGSQVLIPIRMENGLSGKTTSMASLSPSSGSLGQFASPAKTWGATIELLTSIISYVRVDDAMFDEILDLLSDSLGQHSAACEALEAINADAVWLARLEQGFVDLLPVPPLDGVDCVEMTIPQKSSILRT